VLATRQIATTLGVELPLFGLETHLPQIAFEVVYCKSLSRRHDSKPLSGSHHYRKPRCLSEIVRAIKAF
jgi:hypothetical protein